MKQLFPNATLFTFSDPDDYSRLQEAFQNARFSNAGLLETIGIENLSSIKSEDLPLLLHLTSKGTARDIFIRLFLMEMPVNAGGFEKAIKPLRPEILMQAGLVTRHDQDIHAMVKILPFNDLLLTFDLPDRLKTESRQDYVMGVASSTITLSYLTLRRHCKSTLDLGSGCGTHAFLASSHSDIVTAVDNNPRAAALTAFNARLNGIKNVECLLGDLFSPVAGRTFDLVVTNPPFVISPEKRYTYRDSGMEGDGIIRKIVQDVRPFLTEGGFCQMLCNWAQKDGRNWGQELEKWFEGNGCDVWVMRSETLHAAAYASKWIQHTEFNDDTAAFAQRFRHWMAYYETLGIESFGMGLITMRKSGNHSHWFYAEEIPEKIQGPCGEAIAKGFEVRDFLETVKNDTALLDLPFRHSPHIRLEQHFEPSKEGWKTTGSFIHLAKGFAYRGQSDTLIANLMIQCDGQKPLRDLIPVIAEPLNLAPDRITPALCQLVRKLVAQGFLFPESKA